MRLRRQIAIWALLCVLPIAACARAKAAVKLTSISVAPASASVIVGASQQFTATANYSNGTHTDVTSSATWTSSNPSAAAVSGGLATGVAAGSSTITAAFSTKSGSATLAVTSSSPPPGISFVQVNAGVPSSGQTVTVPFQQAQTAGNLNIIVVGWNDSTSTVQSIADSQGNPYVLAIGPTTGTALRQSLYYAPNIKSGANSVTVQFSQSVFAPDIRVLEYSGVTTLDVVAGASGAGTSASSGSATTNVASELIFGADTISTSTTGPGTGFTSRIVTLPDSDLAEDKTVTSVGSYSATAGLSSGNWVMQMATFYAGNPPPPPPITVTVSPSSATVNTGGTQQFTAMVSNTPNTAVTWTASGGTVSQSGLFTAPATAQTDTITATSQADTTKSGQATATVVVPAQHSVALSWSDADPVTFNVYRGTISGGPYSPIQSGVSSLAYTDGTVQNGQTYFYVVTAFDGTLESAYSTEAQAIIP